MWRKISIHWLPSISQHQIMIPKEWEAVRLKIRRLSIGNWSQHVIASPNDELPVHSIGLSDQIRRRLTLPDSLTYDLCLQDGSLRLGPVIAILTQHQPSQATFESARGFLLDYASIHGLVYLCSLNGINPQTQTISGYYFDPGAAEHWREGKQLPYPDVIYRRARYRNNHAYDHLLERVRGKVFNPYFFDKLELWRCFHDDAALQEHLPVTQPWANGQTLLQMLRQFRSVYLKPARGSLGAGIVRIDATISGYLLTTSLHKKNRIQNKDHLMRTIKGLIGKRSYLLQQAVGFKHQMHQIDFRVIMQKDSQLRWGCTGIIARYGHKGRICTNEVRQIYSGKAALQQVYGLRADQVDVIYNHIAQLCITACQAIDRRFGQFGDVGIDMALDSNLHAWFLEINGLHRHSMASYVEDEPELYTKVLIKPLQFAKAYAGFE